MWLAPGRVVHDVEPVLILCSVVHVDRDAQQALKQVATLPTAAGL